MSKHLCHNHACIHLVTVAILACLSGCVPAGDRASGSVASGHPTAQQTATAPSANATTQADGDSAVARYFRREWSIHRANGTVAFEAPQSHDCRPLPQTRPQDLSVSLIQRGYQPEDTHYFGVTDVPPCRFTWTMPWLDPPAASCRILSGSTFDRVFSRLRTLDLHTIRIQHLTDVSPHRGGSAIIVRWSSSVCEITDMLHSDIDQRDRGRLDAAIEVFREAYNQQTTENP